MKTSAIVCAVLAGTFGFGSIASAQTAFHRDRDDRGQRIEQHRGDGRDFRHEQRREERGYRQGWQAQQHYYHQPRYMYEQPRHAYQQPSYRASHRFFRGGYLPHQYRQPVYYVNNWNAYPSLYAPPYGYQWMNVDGEFLLVALATGLIANALLN